MNAMKAVRAAELRKKLAAIPGKMLLSILILIGIKWDTDIHTVIAHLQADPLTNIRLVIYIYGGVSYVYTFISLFHNWLIGI
ncbi:MAG: hypothetical protein K6G57_04310, partial [Lachnospiraceae bacterium]|nr:hypothetical protein [Lachnospiraceae bacterium]